MSINETNDTPIKRLGEGAKASLPILLGMLPFGAVLGVTAAEKGFLLNELMGMNFMILAGASQLAGMQLIDLNASPIVIILTAWVINLRFALYSASIAPYFQKLNLGWKIFLSWFLTDQMYVLSLANFQEFPNRKGKRYFYTGVGFMVVFTFISGTALGYLAGTQIPESWQLGFAIPLTFLVLVIPSLIDKPTIIAGIFAGIVATLAKDVPYHLGLLIAVFLAIPFGLWLEKRSENSGRTEGAN